MRERSRSTALIAVNPGLLVPVCFSTPKAFGGCSNSTPVPGLFLERSRGFSTGFSSVANNSRARTLVYRAGGCGSTRIGSRKRCDLSRQHYRASTAHQSASGARISAISVGRILKEKLQ